MRVLKIQIIYQSKTKGCGKRLSVNACAKAPYLGVSYNQGDSNYSGIVN